MSIAFSICFGTIYNITFQGFCLLTWQISCFKMMLHRSSRSQMFHKIVILRNFGKFTGKHLCRSLFLIKLQRGCLQFFIKKWDSDAGVIQWILQNLRTLNPSGRLGLVSNQQIWFLELLFRKMLENHRISTFLYRLPWVIHIF